MSARSGSHHIICGLGQVGFLTARLLGRLGEQVTVVSREVSPQYQSELESLGVTVICADARSSRVLMEAGIMTAKSVLCAASNDLANVEIALDALRLRPDTPLVVRLGDNNLADKLHRNFGIAEVLSMPRLAAPAFAAAALGQEVKGAVRIQGEPFVVVEGDHATTPLVPGYGLTPLERPVRERLARVRPFRWGRGAGRFWHDVNPALKPVVWMLGILGLLSVFVFQFGLRISPLDAAYFVVTTLTTTGYGDINVKDADPWLKVYAILLMGLGSAAMAILYSIVTDFVVGDRLRALRGRRRVELTDHVVVVGLGDVGLETVLELDRLGVPVAAVDLDPDCPNRGFLPERCLFLAGDARSPEALEKAGMADARSVVVCTDNDAVNLSIALSVKAHRGSLRTVVRLFDENFAGKVQELLSVDAALSGALIAAPAFVGAALYDDALLCCQSPAAFFALRAAEAGDAAVIEVLGRRVQVSHLEMKG
jgi:Trk K+ transport system NAD-binding subunit